MANPIGNAERAEFGEITVVENQNEMCWLVAEAFQHVRVTAWKVPDVTRIEVVRFALPGRIDHSGAHTTFQDERPLGSRCVPVKLAHHTRLQLHRHASDPFGDRQLFGCHFLAKAVAENFALGFLQFEFERGQLFSGQ